MKTCPWCDELPEEGRHYITIAETGTYYTVACNNQNPQATSDISIGDAEKIWDDRKGEAK